MAKAKRAEPFDEPVDEPVEEVVEQPTIGVLVFGDAAGLHTVQIHEQTTVEVLVVEGNNGRVLAFHRKLAELIDLIRTAPAPEVEDG